jgi:hypothetical protein
MTDFRWTSRNFADLLSPFFVGFDPVATSAMATAVQG